jgi:predicted lipase
MQLCSYAKRGTVWPNGYNPFHFGCPYVDTQGFYIRTTIPRTKRQAHILCFRGTELDRLKDIFTDALTWKKVIPYGNARSKIRVHYGFLRSYKSVRETIHTIVEETIAHNNPTIPVITIGHSLGGALANLCALDLQYQFSEGKFKHISRYVKSMTVGSPRVGNGAFVKSYNKRVPHTYRFDGTRDIVTRLPPWLFGFRHVDTKFDVQGAMHDLESQYMRKA